MRKAFLFHGAYGSPLGNWFQWLTFELKKLGFDVVVPSFPTPEGQSVDSWHMVFDGSEFDDDSIVIGHSLGATFLLHLLEEHSVKVAYLVSGFIDKLGKPEFDDINVTFLNHAFDWSKIVQNCPEILVIYGDDDPYVPEKYAARVAEKLGVTPLVVEGGGHLNTESGFHEFPLLLEKIREDM